MTQIQIDPEYDIPARFFTSAEGSPFCIFLISCDPLHNCPFMGTPPEELVGYTVEEFKAGGARFWFSLIHPDDVHQVSGKIIDAHEALSVPNPASRQAVPILLRYRLTHADGHYIYVKDSRFFLSQPGEGTISGILCKIELVGNLQHEGKSMRDLLMKAKPCNKFLEAAFIEQNSYRKQTLVATREEKYNSYGPAGNSLNDLIPKLTPREKEILRMVADGLSSKMIADQCHITINTVETHRRHLLEKLQVRNSMELIKEASKVFVL